MTPPGGTSTPTRRSVLAGGAGLAVAGATSAQVLTAGSAAAAELPMYPANPFTATPVPSSLQLHYLNRLGTGFSPGSFAQLRAAGGAAPWLTQQLTPSRIAESTIASKLSSWFPDLHEDPASKWSKNRASIKGGSEYAAEFASYTLMRRIYSNRPVLETMTDFWSNHLHVFAKHELAWVHRASYDNVIRKHALGRFEDMLVEASLHPAMLLYLDNWRSTRIAPNENQGRELLELHTVGRGAGYTEAMVKDSARILSGYTVDAQKTWVGFYEQTKHATGPVSVLGFSHANAAADGRAVAVAYLRYLARHPATAARIARKLASYFVSDNPSASLVSTLAKAYTSSGTDIKATMRALISHPDFSASRGRLTRTPNEDFVATCRVLGVTAQTPTGSGSFARMAGYVPQTTLVYQWPRPDGLPRGEFEWSTAGNILNSFETHWNLGGGYWPRGQVVYRSAASWLPKASIRFDQYVDHLSRVILGRPSTSRLLSACVLGCYVAPNTTITASHPIADTQRFVRLLAVLLDNRDHLRR